MFKKLSLLSTAAVLATATTDAIAESKSANMGISIGADSTLVEDLPTKGSATVSGIVQKINNDNKLTIADSNGSTIDVNTKEKIDVQEGDIITASGTLDSEFIGMGKEINNATISRAGLDLDSTRGHDISLSVGVDDEPAPDSYQPKEVSSIKELPDEGMVKITGTVYSIDNKDSFTLKDGSGETVNIHGEENLSLKKGDKVTITGEVKGELAGIGEKIQAKEIMKLSYNY